MTERVDDAGGADAAGLEDSAVVLDHELKAPLANIRVAVDFAARNRERLPPERLDEMLEIIRRNVDRAALLLDRLSLARDIEDARVALSFEELDLVAHVRDVVAERAQVSGRQRVELCVPGSLHLEADVVSVHQMVCNLLSNAEKYSPPEAPIIVTVDGEGEGARVIVRDRGPGVPEADATRIFDKYYQGDPGVPGVGLGLFISRGLARAHGGDIRVRPAPERGSEFVLELPTAAGAEPTYERLAAQ